MDPFARPLSETRKIAPGAEEVVQAGDLLVITDADGQEIAVRGEECDEVMAVLVALDDYVVARAGGVQGVVVQSLWDKLCRAHAALPAHVTRQLPSRRPVRVPRP